MKISFLIGLILIVAIAVALSQPVPVPPTQKLLPIDYGDLDGVIVNTEEELKRELADFVKDGKLKYLSDDSAAIVGGLLNIDALTHYGKLLDVYRLRPMRSPEVNRHKNHGVHAPIEKDGESWYRVDVKTLMNFANMLVSEKTGVGILGSYPRFIEAVKIDGGYKINPDTRRFYNELIHLYGAEFSPELVRDDGLELIPVLENAPSDIWFFLPEDRYQKFKAMNGWRLTKTVPSSRPKDWKFIIDEKENHD